MDFLTIIIILILISFSVWRKLNEQRREFIQRKTSAVSRGVVCHEFPEENKNDCKNEASEMCMDKRANEQQISGLSNRKQSDNESPEGYRKGRGIAMHSPSDARKAFLYSEIFRRKYD